MFDRHLRGHSSVFSGPIGAGAGGYGSYGDLNFRIRVSGAGLRLGLLSAMWCVGFGVLAHNVLPREMCPPKSQASKLGERRESDLAYE